MAIRKTEKAKKPPTPESALKTVKVWGTASFTLNLGDYENLKIEIGEEAEVLGGHDEAIRQISRCLREAAEGAITEVIRDIPVIEKGLKPSGRVAIHFKEKE